MCVYIYACVCVCVCVREREREIEREREGDRSREREIYNLIWEEIELLKIKPEKINYYKVTMINRRARKRHFWDLFLMIILSVYQATILRIKFTSFHFEMLDEHHCELESKWEN